MILPSIIRAEQYLVDAEKLNPGAWVAHNRVAGFCADKISEKCAGMDANAAYVLGILHDIGRRLL